MVLCRSDHLGGAHRGWVLGWGSSMDAHHLTAPDPRGVGLALAAERALRVAGVTAGRVGAVNAHGTATVYNDQMESRAIRRVFGPTSDVPVYSVKGALGHTLGAAGAIEAVVSLAAMAANVIPPTVTSEALDPDCDVNLVTHVAHQPVDMTLSLSAGFGGSNAALVLASEQFLKEQTRG